MLSSSFTYAFFFALVMGVHWALRGRTARLVFLLAASAVFYATWSVPFLALLALSIGVDYSVGHAIVRRPERKRLYLATSLFVNLGVLAFFKYADFLMSSAAGLGELLGLATADHDPFHFVLPLGISFYTFQTLSYTIDVYRGLQRPVDSLLSFSVYVTFFPQLVAGPIVRAHEMLPQLARRLSLSRTEAVEGLTRIGIGLAKKILVADWLATVVEPVYAAPAGYTPWMNAIAVYAYAFQIYFDFSGYSDLAIGSARLLGFRLPENFFSPYLSANITDYWRRWHVTLSHWLRDYLYIPLGGGRCRVFRARANLMITMLLGGLWHGAAWTFVAWGGIHGLLLVLHKSWTRLVPPGTSRARAVLGTWLTFHAVCLSYVFFRSPDFETAGTMLGALGGAVDSGAVQAAALFALAPALLLAYAAAHRLADRARAFRPASLAQNVAYGLAWGVLILLLATLAAPPAEFIYFQF